MISFNNIPTTVRTPGAHAEIDNSRALQGLAQNPHKALIIGEKTSSGTVDYDTVIAISSDNLADGYFGSGSVLARMCNVFKDNNPNTELYAMAIGSGVSGTAAEGGVYFSVALESVVQTSTGTYYLMINGVEIQVPIAVADSVLNIVSAAYALINDRPETGVTAASGGTGSAGRLVLSAINSGTLGNYINIRANYYTGQSTASVFSTAPTISAMASGATDPDLGDAWAVIDNERYNYIIQPWTTAANLTEIEDELEDRFGPLIDKQGHGFTAYRGTVASCTTLGNSRNSPYNTIMGAYDSPSGPPEWAAALGAKAAFNLNVDPARPLHFLKLKGILPPPAENRFTRAERDVLLYDGIATYRVDNGGNVLIDRCITTYQTNALGITDPSYLDVNTLATLGEIRDQWLIRMSNRFLAPRFKLADDTFPVQPGTYVATPGMVKQETIALFTLLRDRGLIENLDDFIENLVVERNLSDVNRVDVLLPCDVINQFRIIAGKLQFIL